MSQIDAAPAGTVLIVEDNPDCVCLWERYLTPTQCRVVATQRGEDALDLARREGPAAVILDLNLPTMSGWEVLKALKADPATKEIPVIICSALPEHDRGLAEGASSYLQKPVGYQTFRQALDRAGALSCGA